MASKKNKLTKDTNVEYDYDTERCKCKRVVLLRKNALIVGEVFVKCPECRKWVRISDISYKAQ